MAPAASSEAAIPFWKVLMTPQERDLITTLLDRL